MVNQKGGVGKTTSSINIAAGLAQSGKKTLVIDVDSQGNATSGLGVSKSELDASIFDVFAEERSLGDILVDGPHENLKIAPANNELLSAESQLATLEDGRKRLKKAVRGFLENANGPWLPEYIIIDCPPSLGQLTINAIIASTSLLIPVQCEYYALEGLTEIFTSATFIRQQYNPALQMEGILLTMADRRLNLSQQVEQDIRAVYPQWVFRNVIYRSVRLSEAPSHGLPIMMYDPQSKGAKAYLGVAEEIIQHETQSPRPWPFRSAV